MTLGKSKPTTGGIHFCTFVCWRHIPLIDKTGLYDSIYEKLQRWTVKGCAVNGFVVMPNHVHLLMYAPSGASINEILGNCKRWWAKVIIDRLTEAKDHKTLFRLQRDVDTHRYAKGQWFRVWEPSSDIKTCFSEAMLLQKLDYIHRNPLQEHWRLAETPEAYVHSSAAFYSHGSPTPVPVVHWKETFR